MRDSFSPYDEDDQYLQFVNGLNGIDRYRLDMAYQKMMNIYASAHRATGIDVSGLLRISAKGVPKF